MFPIPRIPSHPVLAALAALPLLAAPALGQTEKPWLHVQVQDESDETKVEVNLPLAAVEAFGDSIGERLLEHATEAAGDSGDFHLELDDLRAIWQALRAEPGAWVRMQDDDGNLRARMDGDEIRIQGSDGDGSLEVRFPVALGDALFEGPEGEPDFSAAIRTLADHEGDLVSVTGDDGQVRVWIGPQ